ncbi:uncharacterized protein LOC118188766, partial [Stegodyphus dumicola]|uniref:uncharacterized protein LOC118188766 n=1 Tax=Stegodyphus dumicola TaxID=202533 RepID=UPI0015AF0EC7
MRILCFALFLGITGILGLDELCFKNPAFVCRSNNVNVTIAKDVEELMELCPRYIDYVECLGHYDRTCAEKGRGIFFQPHGYKNLHGVLLDLCDSESSLHK